jgi:hypothetical protein
MEHQEKVRTRHSFLSWSIRRRSELREAQKYSDYLRTEISKVNKLIAKNGGWNEADESLEDFTLEDFTLRLDDNKAHLKKAHLKKLRDSMTK